MIVSKLRETLLRSCRSLLHPAIVPAPLRQAPALPHLPIVPGNASLQGLCASLQTRRPLGTARPGWEYFLQEGQKHLSAGRLADAQVYMEHAEFLAGAEPAVQRGLVLLTERRYQTLLRQAEVYQATGHVLEAHAALAMAHNLKPNAALRSWIERLDD